MHLQAMVPGWAGWLSGQQSTRHMALHGRKHTVLGGRKDLWQRNPSPRPWPLPVWPALPAPSGDDLHVHEGPVSLQMGQCALHTELASAPGARLQPPRQQRAPGPRRPPSPRRGGRGGVGVWAGYPLTVSSVQMECTWVPNITDVKMRKSSPSKHSRMRRITVVGGEKELHSAREGACGLRAGPGLALPPAL